MDVPTEEDLTDPVSLLGIWSGEPPPHFDREDEFLARFGADLFAGGLMKREGELGPGL